jgi:hypothetical protein
LAAFALILERKIEVISESSYEDGMSNEAFGLLASQRLQLEKGFQYQPFGVQCRKRKVRTRSNSPLFGALSDFRTNSISHQIFQSERVKLFAGVTQ